MITFEARYSTDCTECGGRIQPGEQIARVTDGRSHDHLGYRHGICPPDVAARDDSIALAQPRCARCGLNHPGEC